MPPPPAFARSRPHRGPERRVRPPPARRHLRQALSPAPNDPTTTVLAQDRTEDGLLPLAGRPLGPTWLLDHAGRLQDHVPQPQWVDIVSLAVYETVPYRTGHPQSVRRLNALSSGHSRPCPRTGGLWCRAPGGTGVPERRRAERPPAAPSRLRSGRQGPGGPNARGTGNECPT
ncbi:DUF2254 family protein [Streptomyces sp. NPDC096354]|uniref:DUF2254 family protein n=1 Tax=Streptomyces sp. NPDC096354 TaxID=3366088 RepID=UPI00380F0E89